ncbi:MAG: VWA domain-containing protein [Archaeoglobaceae archaeon]|nr:VWA domain-containing protein [Archaeoglobaceae archaeon]
MYFPFTAIVGQEKAKLALLCNAVNPAIGGVLLSGDKGTGKSTMVRALADVLPEIEVVKDCPFNCNPKNEFEMCEACVEKKNNGEIEIVRKKMRVVDLPLSVTVDRLVGTIDIQKALKEGIKALQPGILAEANRNILYIDEVNLLDDYIADILLDSAAMGWNVIEREGVSLKHPSRFILVGSMNPEEGELRPQILDRFGLFVDIEASDNIEERIEIVKRVEEFQADPLTFRKRYERQQKELRESVEKARKIVNRVEVNDDLLKLLAKTIIENGIKTHRAEIVTVKTTKAIAALDGRKKATLEDLKKAMELALPHRIKLKPFEQPSPLTPPHHHSHSQSPLQEKSENEKKNEHTKQTQNQNSEDKGNGERQFEAVDVNLNISSNRGRNERDKTVRGSKDERATVVGYPHGYPVSNTIPSKSEQLCDIDLVATIRAAASNFRNEIDDGDIRVRVRKMRVPRLTVLMLDSSGSMAAMRRISIAKGIAKKIIENSYVKRDSLALVSFRGYNAEILVPPTRRYADVMNALQSVKTGGRTPLSSALQTLLMLTKIFRMKNKNSVVKCILISDGKANTPLFGKPIKEEIQILTSALKNSKVKFEIYNTKTKSIDPAPSYVEMLSELLNAPIYRM